MIFVFQRFNRYPLIIDPSGQATEFIMREFRDRKITKTSFLDDSFRKNLESALRFGNPLLVQVCVDRYPNDIFLKLPCDPLYFIKKLNATTALLLCYKRLILVTLVVQ